MCGYSAAAHTLPQAAGHSADAASLLEGEEYKQQMVTLGKDGTQCRTYLLHGPHRLPRPGEEADFVRAVQQRG